MSSATSTETGLQPWQFFVLAALACATVVTYMVRGQGAASVVLLTVLMGSAALVGLAALRTLRPLVTSQDDRVPMVGARTRVALEREKMLTLRAIKELEFDRAMGKLSEQDFTDLAARLRRRASRLMRDLDAGAGYRERIERDLAKRLGDGPATPRQTLSDHAARVCQCGTENDYDAKFCKSCGERL